ncbi:hypothetical protein N9U74_03385 [Synechococcus sp. AH-736-M02]|nr:hypothetical protein [Synechococcus sp. AH-736-M02]
MATFDEFYESLPEDSSKRGEYFEKVFVPWFLKTDPEWSSQVQQVWLWDDYPQRWGKDCGPFAFLWKHLLVNRSDLLGELSLLTSQKTGQLLVDAEVSTDKPLLTADLGVHAASPEHDSVEIFH